MTARDDIAIFQEARPRLLGLAYRILGSRADAEDAVQDTFLKWRSAGRPEGGAPEGDAPEGDAGAIENPAAWLMTICTRRCIDLLRAADRSRVDYVGSWLPEPVQTGMMAGAVASSMAGPEDQVSLASSLTTAFLLLLQRLTPKERAAYLLHEIFEMDYTEIAKTLDMEESACRKLVSRARANVDQAKVRHVTPAARQEELLAAFETAISAGDTTRLAALLSDDIALAADGGGRVSAIPHVLQGRAEVLDFVIQALHRYWQSCEWIATDINGNRGVILRQDGATVAAVSFAYDEAGRLTGIYIMRNPDKLARLDVPMAE